MPKLFFVLAAIALAAALAGCHGARGKDGISVVGPKGDTGVPGVDGSDGAAGADGQPAQVVQLCPGTTSYPNTFVEVALLINGKLYAVYSTHGGFLTYIPPGIYSSNAVGSSCNFRVNADNSITAL